MEHFQSPRQNKPFERNQIGWLMNLPRISFILNINHAPKLSTVLKSYSASRNNNNYSS